MESMMEVIWGVKTQAVFDVWTFEHILSGISCGSAVMLANHKSLGQWFHQLSDSILHPKAKKKFITKHDLIFVLFLAYAWETLEHYLEIGLAGQTVEYWFQGVEMWANRLISDPLMLVLGYMIAKQFPVLVKPARVLSITWLIVHIFVFPHSMYLHEIL